MADLKVELKKALAETHKKQGLPPMIDKTITSIWDQFKKSQPMKLAEKGLSDQWKDSVDVWENLQHALEKYSVDKKCIELTMKKLKNKYGEKPTETEVRMMLT